MNEIDPLKTWQRMLGNIIGAIIILFIIAIIILIGIGAVRVVWQFAFGG